LTAAGLSSVPGVNAARPVAPEEFKLEPDSSSKLRSEKELNPAKGSRRRQRNARTPPTVQMFQQQQQQLVALVVLF